MCKWRSAIWECPLWLRDCRLSAWSLPLSPSSRHIGDATRTRAHLAAAVRRHNPFSLAYHHQSPVRFFLLLLGIKPLLTTSCSVSGIISHGYYRCCGILNEGKVVLCGVERELVEEMGSDMCLLPWTRLYISTKAFPSLPFLPFQYDHRAWSFGCLFFYIVIPQSIFRLETFPTNYTTLLHIFINRNSIYHIAGHLGIFLNWPSRLDKIFKKHSGHSLLLNLNRQPYITVNNILKKKICVVVLSLGGQSKNHLELPVILEADDARQLFNRNWGNIVERAVTVRVNYYYLKKRKI